MGNLKEELTTVMTTKGDSDVILSKIIGTNKHITEWAPKRGTNYCRANQE